MKEDFPVLIVSATRAECAPMLRRMTGLRAVSERLYAGMLGEQRVEVLTGGIGGVCTAFSLTHTLMQRAYRFAVSMGIAGSFANGVHIGDTVQIVEDCFADLGIDDNGRFRSLREEGLTGDDGEGDFMINCLPVLSPHRKVRGITVQMSSGSRDRVEWLAERYHPDVETMENAAFFYVCSRMKVPFAAFRAISNMVEPRNRGNWRVAEAIEQVNDVLDALLRSPNGL